MRWAPNKVTGVDLSLSSTGVADSTGKLHTIRPATGAADPPRRLHEIVTKIDDCIPDGDLVVIEDIGGGWKGNTLRRIAELHGGLQVRLFERCLPFRYIPQKSLKKYATGDGAATKEQMLGAAQSFAISRSGQRIPANHDEADALLLRFIGLEGFDLDRIRSYDVSGGPLHEYRARKLREWFGKVTW